MTEQVAKFMPPEVEAFLGVPLFEGITEDAVRALALAAEEAVYPKGELIFREGELGDRFCVIGDGEVEVVKGLGTPNEVVLARLGSKEFFGEMSLIEGQPRSASIRAARTSIIYVLTNQAIARFSRFWPEFHSTIIFNIAAALSRRLREIDRAVASAGQAPVG
ncbi:MAG: cyclic nucleotide-binding domain-containing protein [Verrucomicrobiae bacterium]|nr:cyclic nucleotide-binding domain-containing protein [Verrucomicrobiae bacterium]